MDLCASGRWGYSAVVSSERPSAERRRDEDLISCSRLWHATSAEVPRTVALYRSSMPINFFARQKPQPPSRVRFIATRASVLLLGLTLSCNNTGTAAVAGPTPDY